MDKLNMQVLTNALFPDYLCMCVIRREGKNDSSCY